MSQGFVKMKVGTLTLGEKLRKIRENKRITISQVSEATHIQRIYIQYLEAGAYDKLPADVYVRGFLRSYGLFLGIDSELLVRLFEKEKGIRQNIENSNGPKEKIKKTKPIVINSFVFTPKKMLGLIFLCGAIFAVVYIYHQIGSFTDAPRLIITSPLSGETVEGNSTTLEGITDRDVTVFVNDQAVLVGDEGHFQEVLTLKSGMNTISVRAINKFQKESIQNLTLNAAYLENPENGESVAGEEEIKISEPEGLTLEIHVDPGPVRLNLEADGVVVFSGTMLTGSTHTFTAKDQFKVNSGKASATYLKFNNEDWGALSQENGAVKNVIFNKDTQKPVNN